MGAASQKLNRGALKNKGYPDDLQILPSKETTMTDTSSWYLRRSPWGISSNSWKSIPANWKENNHVTSTTMSSLTTRNIFTFFKLILFSPWFFYPPTATLIQHCWSYKLQLCDTTFPLVWLVLLYHEHLKNPPPFQPSNLSLMVHIFYFFVVF